MKKNYFGKIFAIAMVFAGLSLTSCDKNDNAIINGQVWEPSSTQLVDGGAIVNADTPSEISRMIGRLRQDIIKAAQNKETFTITIDATAIKTTAADNTISFLTINNGDLVVNFTGNIITDEPLVLQSKGVDENQGSYGTAIAKVAFNFPAGTSNIDLKVDMPKASVTVKPTSGSVGINELSAKTAWTTMYIESGVTVNWLDLKGGNVVIKNGAQINGLESTSLSVYPNGITSNGDYEYWNWIDDENYEIVHIYNPYLVKDSLRTTTSYTEKDYYYVQKGKLLAQENGDYSSFNIIGRQEKASADPIEIIIPDGVKAWAGQGWNGDSYDKVNWPTVNVTGEGDAAFMYRGRENSDGKVYPRTNSINLTRINKLTNVKVDLSKVLVLNNEDQKYEVKDADLKDYWTYINLPVNSEGCTFKARSFRQDMYNLADDLVSSTHKNSTFNTLEEEENNETFNVYFPKQTSKRKSFTLGFDACEFNKVGFYAGYSGAWEEYDGFKGYISLNKSTIGGKAITTSSNMIYYIDKWSKWDEKAQKSVVITSTNFKIDGTEYEPINKDGKWYLLPVE